MFYTLVPQKVLAFKYFDKSIDYWNIKKSEIDNKEDKSRPTKKRGTSISHSKDSSKRSIREDQKEKFDWEPYLNPQSPKDLEELFREGDYTPPKPLLELANNPTDENIKNWFRLIEKRNHFLNQLNLRMSEYLKKNKGLASTERSLIEKQREKVQTKPLDYRRFQFLMYFESSCPHCKRMMSELIKLKNMGFYIELRQVDNEKSDTQGLPFTIRRASKSELKARKIDAWPVLFVGDKTNKVVYRIDGFQTAENILFTLQGR